MCLALSFSLLFFHPLAGLACGGPAFRLTLGARRIVLDLVSRSDPFDLDLDPAAQDRHGASDDARAEARVEDRRADLQLVSVRVQQGLPALVSEESHGATIDVSGSTRYETACQK